MGVRVRVRVGVRLGEAVLATARLRLEDPDLTVARVPHLVRVRVRVGVSTQISHSC